MVGPRSSRSAVKGGAEARAVGEPWPNYLIKKIMALGRRLGYSKIGLRRPQSLHWYKRPVGVGTFDFGDRFRVRRLMRRFYSNVRKGLGFRLREGDYWVKSL